MVVDSAAIVSTETIIVTGSLVVTPTGSLTLTSGGFVNVTATTTITNGTLVLGGVTQAGRYTVIKSGGGIKGAFETVTVSADPSFVLESCQVLQGVQELDASLATMSVLVTIEDDSGCDDGSLSTGAIIGIAVGCTVFVAVVASIIGFVLHKKYRARHPRKGGPRKSQYFVGGRDNDNFAEDTKVRMKRMGMSEKKKSIFGGK